MYHTHVPVRLPFKLLQFARSFACPCCSVLDTDKNYSILSPDTTFLELVGHTRHRSVVGASLSPSDSSCYKLHTSHHPRIVCFTLRLSPRNHGALADVIPYSCSTIVQSVRCVQITYKRKSSHCAVFISFELTLFSAPIRVPSSIRESAFHS